MESKPTATPMETYIKLAQGDSELFGENVTYRNLIGKLLYLTITRPDISYVVQQLSQFLDKPTVFHLRTLHRVLRYVKAAPGQGLLFPSDNNTQLATYSYSDWASCTDARKSITGFCVFLGKALIQ